MPTRAEPFLGTDAVAAGRFTTRTLRSRNQLIYRNVYLANGEQFTAEQRAVAALLWSGCRATVAGLSAAALHGSRWIDSTKPAELIRAEGRGGGLVEAHRGTRGLVQLRDVLDVMDGGAESPQETRTRLLLVHSGLRRPQTQITVRDEIGYPFARVDLGWEEYLVGVEYDGGQHWDDPAQYAHDIDRHGKLLALGWRIIRVSAELLRYRRPLIVQRTCAALAAAGCGWLAECVLDTRQIA